MAYYKVPIDSYDSFRNTVLGKCYDIDGAYGCQCWDGCALLWQQIGKTLQTGGQNAKGCWLVAWAREANTVPGYFVQVTNVKAIKRGDVVVFNTGAGWFGSTGHIAFADENYHTGRMNFLGQNQGPGHGPNGSPFNIFGLPTSTFLGAFRFISWQSIEPPKPDPSKPTKWKKHSFPWVVAWKHWNY